MIKSVSRVREKLWCDVVIVGGGLAGLSTGIRLKQSDPKLEVCLLEKAALIGDHVLSGCVFSPRGLFDLFPHWESMGAPVSTKVSSVSNLLLFESRGLKIPKRLTPWSSYTKDYIISLSELCRWLKIEAEALGVRVLEGFTAKELLASPLGYIEGVTVGQVGLLKSLTPSVGFQESIEILAKQTVIAEGAGGRFSKELIEKFKLDGLQNLEYETFPQTYSLGFKEVWKVPNLLPGSLVNTFNWPLYKNRGRGFMMRTKDYLHVGLIVGLDYSSPYLDPFEEFQKFKTHPNIKSYLSGGECIEFGSKVLEDGGFFSVPKLSFPGGVLVGSAGGLSNPITLQGSHMAMASGILAAEAIVEEFSDKDLAGVDLKNYYKKYLTSWVFEELFTYRNIRQAFNSSPLKGLMYAYLQKDKSSEKSSFYIENSRRGENFTERECTEFSKLHKVIDYPKKDSGYTFSKSESLERSNNLWKDQPEYILLKKGSEKDALYSVKAYAGIEEKICPTGVFQYKGEKLLIDSTKCIQCGACKIKSTRDLIEWNLPESGTGPQ